MTYVFSEHWERERERLEGLAAAVAPITESVLVRTGVGRGWRCVDVGAGTGSVARWLAERVGPTGEVTATDVDTRYLDALDEPGFSILEHDLTTGAPPGAPFDLVHSRLVVEHVADRERAVGRLAGWVRPGGWLVVTGQDWWSRFPISPAPAFEGTVEACLRTATAAVGFDPAFGRRLPALAADAGLEDVEGELRSLVVRGGTPVAGVFGMTLERLVPAAVGAGLLSADVAAEAMRLCDDPSFVTMGPAFVSVWGRVPG